MHDHSLQKNVLTLLVEQISGNNKPPRPLPPAPLSPLGIMNTFDLKYQYVLSYVKNGEKIEFGGPKAKIMSHNFFIANN